ncbi:hypothetical protein [Paenibacillus silvae]|uniref:Uncharacterized protein n=1 Tax=Paenibacillus silvae TaxID=1325358 RepID=A0A2W6NEE6_9BACL|nr:hypothetical protein [Paenibacillus silvae]PZT54344.1 hypothetical protein DN757_17600 [Paenibacillus silvae]
MVWTIDWIKAMWKSGVIGSVIMPLIAVLIGWWLANWRADRKEKRAEQNQRLKLLHMLRHELNTVLKHYDAKGKYYLRNPLTGQIVNNSSLLNVEDHKELLERLWEYMRGYESLNTAIESIPAMTTPKRKVIFDMSKRWWGDYDLVKYNKLSKHVDDEIEITINGSVKYIIDAAKPLLEEVEKQIRLIENT